MIELTKCKNTNIKIKVRLVNIVNSVFKVNWTTQMIKIIVPKNKIDSSYNGWN